MKLQEIKGKELAEIESILRKEFGIEKLPEYRLYLWGEDRIIAFTGDLSERDIWNISTIASIESLGVYIGKKDMNGIRLSIEGTHLLQSQINKNVFEITDEKMLEEWMSGADLQIATGKKGFLVMKHNEDFLGCGKASESKISNFIPKERRLKVSEK